MEFLLVNTKNCNQIYWHIHLKTGLIWINWQIYASLIGLAQIFCHLTWCHQKCILLKIIRKFAWLKLNYYLQNWESRLQSIKFWKISSQIKINHFLHELFLFFNQSASCLHYSGRFSDSPIKKTFVTLDIQWEKTNLFPKYLIITAIIAKWLDQFNKHIWCDWEWFLIII